MTLKVEACVDLKVEIEPPAHLTRWVHQRTGETYMEALSRELKQWAEEFEEFVRDHRSQDPVSITVRCVMENQCSACRNTWEEDPETGQPLCCDAAIAGWDASRKERTA